MVRSIAAAVREVNLTEAPSPLDMPVNSELPVLNPRRSVRGKLMRLVLATTAGADALKQLL